MNKDLPIPLLWLSCRDALVGGLIATAAAGLPPSRWSDRRDATHLPPRLARRRAGRRGRPNSVGSSHRCARVTCATGLFAFQRSPVPPPAPTREGVLREAFLLQSWLDHLLCSSRGWTICVRTERVTESELRLQVQNSKSARRTHRKQDHTEPKRSIRGGRA